MKRALYAFGRTLRATGAFALVGWIILGAVCFLIIVGSLLVGMVQGVLS